MKEGPPILSWFFFFFNCCCFVGFILSAYQIWGLLLPPKMLTPQGQGKFASFTTVPVALNTQPVARTPKLLLSEILHKDFVTPIFHL